MTATARPLDADARDRYVRLARLLAWSSLAWMTAEGVVAVVAGVLAGSIALIGFGLDSAVEGLASVVIVWRFWGRRALSEAAERRAQKLVAAQFFVLAPYVGIEAARALGLAKQRVGRALGSPATVAEGAQNLLCAYLSLAVLAGLLGNALAGLWWLDPAAALLIAAVAVREGVEAWRGEGL